MKTVSREFSLSLTELSPPSSVPPLHSFLFSPFFLSSPPFSSSVCVGRGSRRKLVELIARRLCGAKKFRISKTTTRSPGRGNFRRRRKATSEATNPVMRFLLPSNGFVSQVRRIRFLCVTPRQCLTFFFFPGGEGEIREKFYGRTFFFLFFFVSVFFYRRENKRSLFAFGEKDFDGVLTFQDRKMCQTYSYTFFKTFSLSLLSKLLLKSFFFNFKGNL